MMMIVSKSKTGVCTLINCKRKRITPGSARNMRTTEKLYKDKADRKKTFNYDDEFKIVLMLDGNCSAIYNEDFPKYLEDLNMRALDIPCCLWYAIFAEFLEDKRISSGRKKSTAARITEEVSNILAEHGVY